MFWCLTCCRCNTVKKKPRRTRGCLPLGRIFESQTMWWGHLSGGAADTSMKDSLSVNGGHLKYEWDWMSSDYHYLSLVLRMAVCCSEVSWNTGVDQFFTVRSLENSWIERRGQQADYGADGSDGAQSLDDHDDRVCLCEYCTWDWGYTPVSISLQSVLAIVFESICFSFGLFERVCAFSPRDIHLGDFLTHSCFSEAIETLFFVHASVLRRGFGSSNHCSSHVQTVLCTPRCVSHTGTFAKENKFWRLVQIGQRSQFLSRAIDQGCWQCWHIIIIKADWKVMKMWRCEDVKMWTVGRGRWWLRAAALRSVDAAAAGGTGRCLRPRPCTAHAAAGCGAQPLWESDPICGGGAWWCVTFRWEAMNLNNVQTMLRFVRTC